MTKPRINSRKPKRKSTSIEGSSEPVQSSSGLKDQNPDDEPKKKRPRFTFAEKKKILQESNVQTTEYICDKYKIHHNTLTKWKSKKKQIYEAALDLSTLTKKKIIHVSEELDNALHLWLLNSVSSGRPVTEPMIQRKALDLNAELGGNPDFKASHGWFEKWKLRKNFRNKIMTEPRQSSSGIKDQNSDDEPKKQRTRFTFAEKKKILQECNVQTTEYICDKYKIHCNTLTKWKSKKEQIYEAALDLSTLTKKKIIHVSEELDNALYLWLLNSVSSGRPVTGPIIQKKALVLNAELGGNPDFKASHGWLEKWKLRKNVRNKMITEPVQSSSAMQDQNPDNEPKKKRRRFTFAEKKKILQECNVQTTEYICDKYKIHYNTLTKWKSTKEQIYEAALDLSTLTKKKMIHVSEELDNALHLWLLNSVSSGNPVTGPMIQRKALDLNAELGGNPDFKASNGWFEKWKLRKNVHNKMMTGMYSKINVLRMTDMDMTD